MPCARDKPCVGASLNLSESVRSCAQIRTTVQGWTKSLQLTQCSNGFQITGESDGAFAQAIFGIFSEVRRTRKHAQMSGVLDASAAFCNSVFDRYLFEAQGRSGDICHLRNQQGASAHLDLSLQADLRKQSAKEDHAHSTATAVAAITDHWPRGLRSAALAVVSHGRIIAGCQIVGDVDGVRVYHGTKPAASQRR